MYRWLNEYKNDPKINEPNKLKYNIKYKYKSNNKKINVNILQFILNTVTENPLIRSKLIINKIEEKDKFCT